MGLELREIAYIGLILGGILILVSSLSATLSIRKGEIPPRTDKISLTGWLFCVISTIIYTIWIFSK